MMQYILYALFTAAVIAFFVYQICRAKGKTRTKSVPERSPKNNSDEAYRSFLNGPGKLPATLVFAKKPFEQYLKDFGPDGLRDNSGVSCWLKPAPGTDLQEALRDCMHWQEAHLAYYQSADTLLFPMYCHKRIVILLESEEIPEGMPPDLLIRLAVVRSETSLFDLWDNQEYTVRAVNYPGSADDAATYGEWYLY